MILVIIMVISMLLIMWDAFVMNYLLGWYAPEFGMTLYEPTFVFCIFVILIVRLVRPVFGRIPMPDDAQEDTNHRMVMVVLLHFLNSLMLLGLGWFFWTCYF